MTERAWWRADLMGGQTTRVDSIAHAMPCHLVNGNLLNYVWINEINTLTPTEVYVLDLFTGWITVAFHWLRSIEAECVSLRTGDDFNIKAVVNGNFIHLFFSSQENANFDEQEWECASSVCTKIWIFNKTNFCGGVVSELSSEWTISKFSFPQNNVFISHCSRGSFGN